MCDLRPRERLRRVWHAEVARGIDIARDFRVLRRRRGDAEFARLAPPDITAGRGGERADRVLRHRSGAGHRQRAIVADVARHALQAGPIAMDLAAILAAGARAAERRLD